MVFGIGQDGLWHFACDDSPFAYIMLVASAFSDFFFHTVRRSWAVLIYRGGLTGILSFGAMKHLQLGYTVHIHSGTIDHIWRCFVMGA